MKIGMKEDMGVADEMAFQVLRSLAGIASICARSALKCAYSQFMAARIIGFGQKSA